MTRHTRIRKEETPDNPDADVEVPVLNGTAIWARIGKGQSEVRHDPAHPAPRSM